MRKKLIAANWKMYKTPDQTREFFLEFLPMVSGHDRDEIVICLLTSICPLRWNRRKARIFRLALKMFTGNLRARLPAKPRRQCCSRSA